MFQIEDTDAGLRRAATRFIWHPWAKSLRDRELASLGIPPTAATHDEHKRALSLAFAKAIGISESVAATVLAETFEETPEAFKKEVQS